eukprot:CAMPEP_0119337032 /NCGR_PEP_ID=MMETSP1333-20130426/93119_1 /TAXON_ID=418940 /ORGANISM="Scyphosphaera apsteinii, Strain RCC1455" /LENGTH=97 /DNA_ID=CAMNT_0007347989 /DNA_START=468 /DNA_END=761 /DNA_ORIENTATION=+
MSSHAAGHVAWLFAVPVSGHFLHQQVQMKMNARHAQTLSMYSQSYVLPPCVRGLAHTGATVLATVAEQGAGVQAGNAPVSDQADGSLHACLLAHPCG